MLPRLRQAVLVAADLRQTCAQLEAAFGLRAPYADPGVGAFGLANAVYEVGDCFLEVVSPVRTGTTAGRFLDLHGDGGYMAIFQVRDIAAARAAAAALGIRTVWSIDLDDIAATHFHPKDVGAAIVSVDEPRPPESWHWGGPRWTGPTAPAVHRGGLGSLTVRADDPDDVRRRWTTLAGGDVAVRFEHARGDLSGITDVVLSLPHAGARTLAVGTATIRNEANPGSARS